MVFLALACFANLSARSAMTASGARSVLLGRSERISSVGIMKESGPRYTSIIEGQNMKGNRAFTLGTPNDGRYESLEPQLTQPNKLNHKQTGVRSFRH